MDLLPSTGKRVISTLLHKSLNKHHLEDDQETDMIEIGKVDAKRDCCPESEQNDTSEIVDSQMGVEDVDELPTKKEVLMNEIGESANGKTDGDEKIVINEYRETQVQKKDDCKGCDASDIKE